VQIISGIVLTITVALASCAMMGLEITAAIIGVFAIRNNSVGCRGSLTIQNFKDKAWFCERISNFF